MIVSGKGHRIDCIRKLRPFRHLIAQSKSGFFERQCDIDARHTACLKIPNPLLKSDGVKRNRLVRQRYVTLACESLVDLR